MSNKNSHEFHDEAVGCNTESENEENSENCPEPKNKSSEIDSNELNNIFETACNFHINQVQQVFRSTFEDYFNEDYTSRPRTQETIRNIVNSNASELMCHRVNSLDYDNRLICVQNFVYVDNFLNNLLANFNKDSNH